MFYRICYNLVRCRYLNVYMRPYDGYYFTGDGCYRDKDGYYWVTGSVKTALSF